MAPVKRKLGCQDIIGLFEKGSYPFLSLQLACAIMLTGTFNVVLGPLNQSKYISSLLAGIAVGPSLLGGIEIETIKIMFDESGGTAILEIVSSIALTFFSFLVGVKTDMDMILKARKQTYVIAFSTFLIPLVFNVTISLVIRRTINLDQDLQASLVYIGLALSCTSFYDTASAVSDLNLLNSEIGRLSLAISIITGMCTWLFTFTLGSLSEVVSLKPMLVIGSWMSKALVVLVVVYVIRPVLSWMNRVTPEGTTLKEGYVAFIFIIVLVSALYSEVIGQHAVYAPIMIGLAVPVGTPIGSAVQKKLECFLTLVLLPSVYIIGGYHVQLSTVTMKNFIVVELMIFLGFVARQSVVMLASLCCRMPIEESISLGLILNCSGIYNLLFLDQMYERKFLNQQTYTIMLLTNALITMVATPIVKHLYDPSRKYAGYTRQTIQNTTVKGELRILACVYNQENVPTILNFFEATYPTRDSPVCIYVLHLVELIGRAASLLIQHKEQKKKQFTRTCSRNTSEKIINAFHQFEEQNQGFIIGPAFTAISPYAVMHNDVCQIAIDKKINLVIMPFGELNKSPTWAVNQSVLHKAPCSVGVLFDHMNSSKSVMDNSSSSYHNVAMIFIGGPDDREALAYSMKIAEKPSLNLSAGITQSSSMLGSLKTFKAMNEETEGVMGVTMFFGLVFFTFLVGVKIDLAMILSTKRKTIIIGCFTFLFPLIVNLSVSLLMERYLRMDLRLHQSLPNIALILSLNASFYDTSCVLDDLNLLNSDIGRQSLSISFVSGFCSASIVFIIFQTNEMLAMDSNMVVFSWMSKALILSFILFFVRPLYSWMIRNTPEGNNLKESYVILILLLVLITSFCSDASGEKPLFGPVLMGLVLPPGPPIGSAIESKLELIITLVILPAFFIVSCRPIDVFNIHLRNFAIIELLVLVGSFVKFTAIFLPSLYCEMPFQDALSVGLILNCDGIFAFLLLGHLLKMQWLDKESYTIIVISKVWITMVATPLVKRLYDPLRRYAGYRRQTIQNHVGELRVLACVYDQDSVPGILNFFKAISPARDCTLCIYVLHLIELVGRAASVLVTHNRQRKRKHSDRARNTSEKILNAFHHFEKHNQGFLIGQAFTAISPFSSMHTDVCNRIMDKRTALAIVPFHESVEHPFRFVAQNVLQKAPCSVGILFDHMNGSRTIMDIGVKYQNVAMIFIGGPDDREALTLSLRMADNPDIKLTVFRLTLSNSKGSVKKTKKDDDVIRDLWSKLMDAENIVYKEEEVTDGADTASKLKAVENTHDFIIVGRRHNDNSLRILLGLDEWCVYKELGVIGDLFATSNSLGKFTTLVVQQ
ncbi:hypothetical protein MKW94_009523 [Papaver nudicaule]|uniref:Cation/H+ exchanger domain-containing protein n=1 Tax=Papaver nudicaule TaxID=74823 RepID=A0AA41V0Y9_PAPNU|nr:hypothetical protein [Papaver nudicaule]